MRRLPVAEHCSNDATVVLLFRIVHDGRWSFSCSPVKLVFPEEAGVDEVFQLHEAGQPELVLHDAVLEAGGGDLLGEGRASAEVGRPATMRRAAAGPPDPGEARRAGILGRPAVAGHGRCRSWRPAHCETATGSAALRPGSAAARALMGFFDYAARRPVRRPADFLTRLMALKSRRCLTWRLEIAWQRAPRAGRPDDYSRAHQ